MTRFLPAFAFVLATAVPGRAANPISTLNYAADPSAHVFGDRLYVYPSHDRTDAKEFDMTDYHVYSTDDLVNWTDHGKVLDVADIPWAKSHMWAPDIAFKDGIYHFYFPVRGKEKGPRPIGVATSKSPAGPFIDSGKPIAGIGGIDPSVFIDDDGTAYIIWAGKGAEIAKLKPSMREIDGPVAKVKGLANFFEGPWIFNRDGTYYLTYPAMMKGGSGDGGNGQWYDYATAKSVLGPYTYRGHFDKSGPGGGNIHGSELEWKGKWYHVYHDFSQSEGKAKRGFKRTVHIDELKFEPDGSIAMMKWTKEGPTKLKDVDPYAQPIQAETTSASDIPEGPHAVTTRGNEKTGVFLDAIHSGDWVKISNLDFGPAPGAKTFHARVAAPKAGSQIVLHLDRLDGPVIGTCPVPATGGFDAWKDVSCPVSGATGRHDLVLEFIGPTADELLNLDFYQFQR